MGLDTSHGCWHGAYGEFHRWRCKLAEVAGLPPLELMEGFFSARDDDILGNPFAYSMREEVIGHYSIQRIVARLPIKWSVLKRNPLHRLLTHSDCDGRIAWRYCLPIAKELEKLLPLLPNEDGGGHISNWRDKTQRFIDGLRDAANKKEAVRFH